MNKEDPLISCLHETHITCKDTHSAKMKGWKKIFNANGNIKRVRIAILTSDKLDLKTKTIRRNTDHYKMIKGSILQDDVTI